MWWYGINKRESRRHKQLKQILETLFTQLGYTTKKESYENNELLYFKGKQPDLILDEKIPVEVGHTEIKKINHYLEKGAKKVYWIPYHDTKGVDSSMEIIQFRRKQSEFQKLKEKKKKIETLKQKVQRLKKQKVQRLKEKLNMYSQLFKNSVIKVDTQNKIGDKHITLPTTESEMTGKVPERYKPKEYESRKEYAYRLYNSIPNITQKEVANYVARYHPSRDTPPRQETISRWCSEVEERMNS